MYGIVNACVVDTEPGSNTAFAPPLGFDGKYSAFLKERFESDPGARQHIAVAVSRMRRTGYEPPTYLGRFAKEAEWMLKRFKV